MNPVKRETIFSLLASTLHLEDLVVIPEGNQNFVFSCSLQGEKSIVKVTDSGHRTRPMLETQLEMLHALKCHNSDVCAPKPVFGTTYIAELELEGVPFYVTAYPYAAGESADDSLSRHGYLMGHALAKLHTAMRLLPKYTFEEISTGTRLEGVKRASQTLGISAKILEVLEANGKGDVQLLHGDFTSSNITIDGSTVTVFDFDNCVYGNAAYELANSLYMVLFDQVQRGRGDLSQYDDFRHTFLAGYTSLNSEPIQPNLIDAFISYRVLLLFSWLEDPDTAPLFIRQSTSSWLATLQKFVNAYFKEIEPTLRY